MTSVTLYIVVASLSERMSGEKLRWVCRSLQASIEDQRIVLQHVSAFIGNETFDSYLTFAILLLAIIDSILRFGFDMA